ncbi:MAG TPA: DinB family protein [Friedmanniella sp.]
MAPDDQSDVGRPANRPEIQPDDKDWTWVLRRRCDECGFEAAAVPREALAERYFLVAEEWVQILRENPAVEARPAPATWSPLEYGAHVRDVLGLGIQRVELMLSADDPTFANWDQDETAVAERYAEQDPEQVADDLEAAAQRLVALIGEIEPRAWERRGTRSNGSVFTVTTLLQYTLHDVVHHLWDVTGQQDGASSLQLA